MSIGRECLLLSSRSLSTVAMHVGDSVVHTDQVTSNERLLMLLERLILHVQYAQRLHHNAHEPSGIAKWPGLCWRRSVV